MPRIPLLLRLLRLVVPEVELVALFCCAIHLPSREVLRSRLTVRTYASVKFRAPEREMRWRHCSLSMYPNTPYRGSCVNLNLTV